MKEKKDNEIIKNISIDRFLKFDILSLNQRLRTDIMYYY